MKHSKAILSLEYYEELKRLESHKIQLLEAEKEDLIAKLESDYIVENAFMNTQYFKRNEWILEISKNFSKQKEALIEKYEERANKIHLFRMMMTGTYVIMWVSFIIIYFNR